MGERVLELVRVMIRLRKKRMRMRMMGEGNIMGLRDERELLREG